jgi:site-specific DNA-methyltransferase (adenine-specific)
MTANKVFCGDARRLLASLPDESIDGVITDPMYGTGKDFQYDWGPDPALGDPEKHWAYHRPIYDECRRVLKPGGVLAWAQGAKFYRHFERWFGAHRVWTLTRFRSNGVGATGHIWVVQTKEQQPVRLPDRDALVVYDDVGRLRKLHPCIKMVEELEFLVESLTAPGDTVLDCFCGLGSTLIAAQRLGRQWIGCDLSPTYCQIALRRLALCSVVPVSNTSGASLY